MDNFLVFIIGIVSAYFGMFISGWVSAIAVWLLLFIGLPPHIAITTYLVWSIGGTTGGIKKFWQSGNIPKKFLFGLTISAVISGVIGSQLLFNIPSSLMYKVTGTTLIILFLYWIFKNDLGKNEFHPKWERIFLGYFLNTLIGIWWVLFPAGVGVVFYFLYTSIFGMTTLQAKWMGRVLGALWAVSLTFQILLHDEYDIIYIILYILGAFIWASFASSHVIRAGNDLMRKIILFGIFWLAIYFLFFVK